MAIPHWQLQTPISAITFDCDGTLSTIEGIDELAKYNGVYNEIHALTTEAMGKTGMNPELYQKRLSLVKPRQNQVLTLGKRYFDLRVTHILEVIEILTRLKKHVYVLSAGIYPAVMQFAELLKIPRENVYAVDIKFDAAGNYTDFDHTSPLIHNSGKQKIIQELKSRHNNIIHVGDGLNDMLPHDLVMRLIGYGGVFFRENIAALCHYYISTASMFTLLPLVLTSEEVLQLNTNEQKLFQQAVEAIQRGEVLHCI